MTGCETVSVIFDPTQYGDVDETRDLKPGCYWPEYNFYCVVRCDEELITRRRGDGTRLTAVTKEQYKSWRAMTIMSSIAVWGASR
jgi:hypothetical protein